MISFEGVEVKDHFSQKKLCFIHICLKKFIRQCFCIYFLLHWWKRITSENHIFLIIIELKV